jgi:hypothetical protein
LPTKHWFGIGRERKRSERKKSRRGEENVDAVSSASQPLKHSKLETKLSLLGYGAEIF